MSAPHALHALNNLTIALGYLREIEDRLKGLPPDHVLALQVVIPLDALIAVRPALLSAQAALDGRCGCEQRAAEMAARDQLLVTRLQRPSLLALVPADGEQHERSTARPHSAAHDLAPNGEQR